MTSSWVREPNHRTWVNGVVQGISMELPIRNWDQARTTNCPAGCRTLPHNWPDNGMHLLEVGYDMGRGLLEALYVVAAGTDRGQVRSGTLTYRGTRYDIANDWGARYQDSVLWRRLNQLRKEDTRFVRKMPEEEWQSFLAASRRWYRRRHFTCNARPRPRGPARTVRILPSQIPIPESALPPHWLPNWTPPPSAQQIDTQSLPDN